MILVQHLTSICEVCSNSFKLQILIQNTFARIVLQILSSVEHFFGSNYIFLDESSKDILSIWKILVLNVSVFNVRSVPFSFWHPTNVTSVLCKMNLSCLLYLVKRKNKVFVSKDAIQTTGPTYPYLIISQVIPGVAQFLTALILRVCIAPAWVCIAPSSLGMHWAACSLPK